MYVIMYAVKYKLIMIHIKIVLWLCIYLNVVIWSDLIWLDLNTIRRRHWAHSVSWNLQICYSADSMLIRPNIACIYLEIYDILRKYLTQTTIETIITIKRCLVRSFILSWKESSYLPALGIYCLAPAIRWHGASIFKMFWVAFLDLFYG